MAAHGLKIKIYCLDRWEREGKERGTLMHIPFPFVYEQHSLANHSGKISCLLASLWAMPPWALIPAVETLEMKGSFCFDGSVSVCKEHLFIKIPVGVKPAHCDQQTGVTTPTFLNYQSSCEEMSYHTLFRPQGHAAQQWRWWLKFVIGLFETLIIVHRNKMTGCCMGELEFLVCVVCTEGALCMGVCVGGNGLVSGVKQTTWELFLGIGVCVLSLFLSLWVRVCDIWHWPSEGGALLSLSELHERELRSPMN